MPLAEGRRSAALGIGRATLAGTRRKGVEPYVRRTKQASDSTYVHGDRDHRNPNERQRDIRLEPMNAGTQAVGVLCIIAAIVGGGLKASGMEIPILRQVILGAFGLVLIAAPMVSTLFWQTRGEQGPTSVAVNPESY
jgi:hypothetical protein